MRARTVSAFLVLCLGATPAFADSVPTQHRLSDGIAAAVSRLSSAENRQLTRQSSQDEDNPYFLPGIVLLAGGGLLLLYGAIHESGAECTSTVNSFNCRTTHSTGVIVAGAAVAGVGGYLLYKGNQRRRSPQIVVGPHQVGIQQRIRW